MIIGNPFMFAILVERVAEWNDSEAEDNGHFAFCIKGEVFPKGIINTPYIIALKNALKALKNEPRKEVLMNEWIREAYETVYHRVFPNEEISKDWNSGSDLTDNRNVAVIIKLSDACGIGEILFCTVGILLDNDGSSESWSVFDPAQAVELLKVSMN